MRNPNPAELTLPSPPDDSASEPSDNKESTGEYLERLSRSILHLNLNVRDSFHPIVLKHMSPAFRNTHDALPKASSRDDHQENLQEHLRTQPKFHVEFLNSSSEADVSRGRATVYLWYEIKGLTHGLQLLEREAVAVLTWERRHDTWMIVKHIGMRGPSGFPTT